jgi:hypothetical protein
VLKEKKKEKSAVPLEIKGEKIRIDVVYTAGKKAKSLGDLF